MTCRAVISNDIRITNYPKYTLEWCEKNLVLRNPDYLKKQRMGFWIGNTPEYLFLYQKVDNTLILPYGLHEGLNEILPADTVYTSNFSPLKPVDYGPKEVGLYEYQYNAVEALYKAQGGLLRAPAGSGKTQIGIALIKKFGVRTLWLTHTSDLLTQSMQRAKQYMDPGLFGTITAGKVNIGHGVTFATVQTMAKLDLSQYRDCWDLIIVDECHRVCGSPTSMTQFYKVLNNLAARYKYGLSATLHRADGLIKSTFCLLGPVAYIVSGDEVEDTVMQVTVLPIGTNICLPPGTLNSDGTINYTNVITWLATHEERNGFIARMLNPEYSTLVLSDRLEQLRELKNALPDHIKEKSAMLDGSMQSVTGRLKREEILESMRSGELKILFATYSLAKEGLDIPRLERLYLATPVKDYAIVTQAIGRVARTFEGKADPVVYDFVDEDRFFHNLYKARVTTYKKNNCIIKDFLYL